MVKESIRGKEQLQQKDVPLPTLGIEQKDDDYKEKKLTAKQERFCQEYLVDLNASGAARRAGYSPRTAFRAGQENMQKPAIQARIQRELDARSKRTLIDADKILIELKMVVGVATELDEDGRMKDAQAACRALELLGRHLNMFGNRRKEREKTSVYVHAPTRPSLAEWQHMVKMSLKPSPPDLHSQRKNKPCKRWR